MEESVFTKIIRGDIPCHKVYEDDKTIAFMDINPVQPGMVVVTVKEQIDNYEDLPEDYLTAMMLTAQKVSKAQRHVFSNKKKMSARIEGLDVPHAHVVLFPIDNADEFRALPQDKEPDHEVLAKQAEQLRKVIT